MKRRFVFLFLGLFSAQALASPAEVLIIRHGEDQPGTPDLSAAGIRRANGLVSVFGPHSPRLRHGPLCAIYAAAPLQPGGSMRPIETVTPVAQASRLAVQTQFTKATDRQMVAAIMTSHNCDGRTVLIGWVHQDIPSLAFTFGVRNPPTTWDDRNYDDIWDINLAVPSSPTMTIAPENL